MFEELGLSGWTPASASVVLGLAIGVLFGSLAQRSRFCLRRGLVGPENERSSAIGTWMMALAVAIAGTASIGAAGLVEFSGHRLLSNELPAGAIVIGGLLFGAGMFFARGCASRLTVLAGSGNLRAAVAVIIFAVTAHAMLKGALAPARVWLSSHTLDLGGIVSLSALPGGAMFWAAVTVIALVAFAVRSGASIHNLLAGGLIGALTPIGWVGTGYVLLDEFDPIALESIAFTSSASGTLFWWIAGTAIVPGFGVGLFGGVLMGSLVAARVAGEFKWVGFSSEVPTGRYLVGGAMMGVGGVLAGGCTIGAGLAGVSMLSVSAILALLSIMSGVVVAQMLASGPEPSPLIVAAE